MVRAPMCTTRRSEITMSLTERESKELTRLLKKIGGDTWLPENVFYALHGVVSMWAAELVIVRKRGGQKEILLAPYEGIFRKSYWHIPGGYNLRDETIQQSCSRIARRELGFDVRIVKILDAYKWAATEHPYGRALSLYVLCEPVGKFKETSRLKFISAQNLPAKTMPVHRKFITRHLL